jgi:hypothetical protein
MREMRLPRDWKALTHPGFVGKGAKLLAVISLQGLLACAAMNISNGAQITPLSSPSSFFPGAILITFEGLQPLTRATSWAGVGFMTLDGRGPDVGFDPDPPREFGPDEQTTIQNILSGRLAMNMYLPRAMVQLGFEMRTQASQNINLTFFAAGSTIQTVTFPTRTPVSSGDSEFYFYAFQSSVPFDRVLVNVTGTDGFFEIDNLRFAPVPEPSVLGLAACGLSAWAMARRKAK